MQATVPAPRVETPTEVHLVTSDGTACAVPATSSTGLTQKLEETTCLMCWARRIREVREQLGLSRRDIQVHTDLPTANTVLRLEQGRVVDGGARTTVWNFLNRVGEERNRERPATDVVADLQRSNEFYLRLAQDAIIKANQRATTFRQPFTRRWICQVTRSYPNEVACSVSAQHAEPWACGFRNEASMTDDEFREFAEELTTQDPSRS